MGLVFFVRSLCIGGAERQLVSLAIELKRIGVSVSVCVLKTEHSYLEDALRSSGITLVVLPRKSRIDIRGFIRAFRELVDREQPDFVYSFLPQANVMSTIALWNRSSPKAVWGVRTAFPYSIRKDVIGWLLQKAETLLSSKPDAVLANSLAGVNYCVARGFPKRRLHYVPNGVDIEKFRFDSGKREVVRRALAVAHEDFLVATIGRISHEKGVDNVIRAIRHVVSVYPHVRLAIVGDGTKHYVDSLKKLVDDLGVASNVLWLGFRDDVTDLYSAADLVCSASKMEGASNTLIEASLCECPTVATRVGDSSEIVKNESLLAQPDDVEDLARVLMTAINRCIRSPQLRASAALEFSTANSSRRTLELLRNI